MSSDPPELLVAVCYTAFVLVAGRLFAPLETLADPIGAGHRVLEGNLSFLSSWRPGNRYRHQWGHWTFVRCAGGRLLLLLRRISLA